MQFIWQDVISRLSTTKRPAWARSRPTCDGEWSFFTDQYKLKRSSTPELSHERLKVIVSLIRLLIWATGTIGRWRAKEVYQGKENHICMVHPSGETDVNSKRSHDGTTHLLWNHVWCLVNVSINTALSDIHFYRFIHQNQGEHKYLIVPERTSKRKRENFDQANARIRFMQGR